MTAILDRIRQRSGARRFLSKGLSVEGFFRELNARSVNYVVLRWYEDLPRVDAGEDIDLLVDDRDLPKLEPLLNGRKSRHQPVDLYSVSGMHGTDFRGVPYYPPTLARGLLKEAVWWNGLFRVPNPRDAFLSMAYHAVYHKGDASNIPSSADGYADAAAYEDHDYVAVLSEKAALAGIQLDARSINLSDLDGLLTESGWRPPVDTLVKLASQNAWVRGHLNAAAEDLPPYLDGLACFVVRERGADLLEEIKRQLVFDGFDILQEGPIAEPCREAARAHIRGGVWERGPWPVNGGPPTYFIVAYDPLPVPPGERDKKQHPGLNNRRLMATKDAVRNTNNRGKPHAEQCNILHSSDNGHQALEYLRVIDPNLEPRVRSAAELIYREIQPPFPVIAELSGNSRRAKVHLVSYDGQEAICKTFRRGRKRFLDREIQARVLGSALPEMSEILESGANYLILKRYVPSEDLYWFRFPKRFRGYIRPRFLKAIREVLLHFRRQGYECVDLKPANFLLDKEAGLKVIDFEFLLKTSSGHDNLQGCLAFFPPDEDSNWELPAGADGADPYAQGWRYRTGVPRALMVHDTPAWLIAVFQAGRWIVSLSTKVARKSVKESVAWLRRARLKVWIMKRLRRAID